MRFKSPSFNLGKLLEILYLLQMKETQIVWLAYSEENATFEAKTPTSNAVG